MSRETILSRASVPTKKVGKVVAVRIRPQSYDILQEEATLAGVRVCDIVRAAIEDFCDSAAKA